MIDFLDFDRQMRSGTLRDPDSDSFTPRPLDPDVADYIRATLCRQRYERELAARDAAPPRAPEASA